MTEFGIRIPVISRYDESTCDMALVNVDRVDAFYYRTASLIAMYNFITSPGHGFTLRGRLGPVLGIETDWKYADVDEVFSVWLNYNLVIGYERGLARVKTGFSGRFLGYSKYISGLDFSRRSDHELWTALSLRVAGLCPGFYIRFPISEGNNDWVDAIWGVSLSYCLYE